MTRWQAVTPKACETETNNYNVSDTTAGMLFGEFCSGF
jgi:hypothetical protein